MDSSSPSRSQMSPPAVSSVTTAWGMSSTQRATRSSSWRVSVSEKANQARWDSSGLPVATRSSSQMGSSQRSSCNRPSICSCSSVASVRSRMHSSSSSRQPAPISRCRDTTWCFSPSTWLSLSTKRRALVAFWSPGTFGCCTSICISSLLRTRRMRTGPSPSTSSARSRSGTAAKPSSRRLQECWKSQTKAKLSLGSSDSSLCADCAP
mmetsp:Transcript_39352/g.94015  ORF Transcript_39352/g.94015 Transcript_39352/m.94015 type:complete len:208 (-) Transcript_39352:1427-2050(-)